MSFVLHGYLVIDKPAGWTSHDVVGRLRRLLREKRIGHAGTLDPAATGVLPVAVGHATKTLEFLTDASKTYLAEITFGVETDSFDADGRVTAIADSSGVDADAIRSVLDESLGPQLQVPPMHSAIKIDGQRLYEAARRGEVIDRPPRAVTFHVLALVDWVPPSATVLVDCSKGTYVRSLAHDLGRAVGPGAHLSNLVRLRSGPFTLCEAWSLTELAALGDAAPESIHDSWPSIAMHPDAALASLPAILVDEAMAGRWRQGKTIAVDGATVRPLDDAYCRTYDASGHWLGIGRADRESGGWRPAKVVAAPAADAHVSVEG